MAANFLHMAEASTSAALHSFVCMVPLRFTIAE